MNSLLIISIRKAKIDIVTNLNDSLDYDVDSNKRKI